MSNKKQHTSLLVERIRNIFLKENAQANKPDFYLKPETVQKLLKTVYSFEERNPLELLLQYFYNEKTKELKYIQDIYSKNMKYIYDTIQKRVEEVGLSMDDIGIDYEQTILSVIKTIFTVDPIVTSFVFYVYSKNSDKNRSIGLIYENGKFDFFEGNDYSDGETIQIANKLVYGNKPKYTKVYGSHGIDVVEQIEKTGMLPSGLYVSPSKQYAAGYWGKDRVLFSGIIDANNVSQESEVDWRVIKEIPIKNFRYE